MKSSPERQHEFDIAYMKMAINGTPSGFPNVCEYYVDCEGNPVYLDNYKPIEIAQFYKIDQLKTKDEVLHAEANAINFNKY